MSLKSKRITKGLVIEKSNTERSTTLTIEHDAANTNSMVLKVPNLAAPVTIELPEEGGNLLSDINASIMQNKDIDLTSTTLLDGTKEASLSLNQPAATVRSFSLPATSGELTGNLAFQTLENKIIDADDNTISNIRNTNMNSDVAPLGQVLTSDGAGGVIWDDAGSGANTTLSNLNSPTSVNQDILPDADNTRDLGSVANTWANVIAQQTNTNAIHTISGSGSIVLGNSLDADLNPITNLPTPSSGSEATNKNYVDSSIQLAVPTGVSMDYWGATAPTGWLLLSGQTIGNASSGATARANADTQALFILLWDSIDPSLLVVSGGRGVSALADFTANKTITLPDVRGRVTVGKDDMGGSAANRITDGLSGSGIDGKELGDFGGTETHTLALGEMPVHNHTVNDPGHSHVQTYGTSGGGATGNNGFFTQSGQAATANTTVSATTGITTLNAGGTQTHNNTQPSIIANKIIKL